MNKQTADLRSIELKSTFKRSDDCMDLRHGKIIGQRTVAAHLNTLVHSGDQHFMDIENLGKGAGGTAQTNLQLAIAFKRGRTFDRRRLTLNMRQHGGDSRNLAAHLRLQLSGKRMSVAQRHGLVHLKVLFDMQRAIVLLHTHVVDDEIGARRNSANTVMNALRYRSRRDGVNDNISPRQMTLHRSSSSHGDLLGTLKSKIAWHAQRDIGKIARPRATSADTVNR